MLDDDDDDDIADNDDGNNTYKSEKKKCNMTGEEKLKQILYDSKEDKTDWGQKKKKIYIEKKL